MKFNFEKGIPMPKVVFASRGSGKTLSAQKELEDFQKEHPDEKVVVLQPADLTQKKLGAAERQSVVHNYNNAIKALIASGKADEILSSDKGKLLSTETFTPTGELSPEWAEYLKDNISKEKDL